MALGWRRLLGNVIADDYTFAIMSSKCGAKVEISKEKWRKSREFKKEK